MPNYDEQKQILTALSLPQGLIDSYIASMKAYQENYDRLNRKDAHGLPYVLTAADYDQLFTLYVNAMTSADDLMTAAESRADASHPIPDFLDQEHLKLMKDYSTMKAVCEKKENVPLELALHHKKHLVYFGNSFDGETLGAMSSSRHVIQLQDGEGKLRLGVFTPAKRYSKNVLAHPQNRDQRNMSNIGIVPNERIDSRNAAMYDIAKLLGRKDLIAKSEDISIEVQGKVLEGNFMDYVSGTDSGRITSAEDSPIKHVDMNDYHTDRAKVDALDLSIIDYICLNLDRHVGNMIYRYETDSQGKTKLNGLVGIDNDMSFGAFMLKPEKHATRLQPLNKTLVITESMARHVMALTPAELRGTLSNYAFSQKAIKRSLERLNAVQTRIRNGRELSDRLKKPELTDDEKAFLNDPIQYADDHQLKEIMVVVPDAHVDKVDIDNIGKHTGYYEPGNTEPTHSGVCNVVKALHNESTLQRLINSNDHKELTNPTPASRPGIPLVMDVRGISRTLSRSLADSVNTFSREIEKNPERGAKIQPITETLRGMFRLTETMKRDDLTPSDNDLNRFSALSQTLKDQCRDFLEQNQADPDMAPVVKSVQSLQTKTADFAPRLRDAQEKEVLEMNVRLAKEAGIINIMAMEMGQAANHLRELRQQEPVNREELVSAAAKAIYMEALNSNMKRIGVDTVGLMLEQDIMAKNMTKLLPKTKEYFEEINPSEETLHRMLNDPDYTKDLLNGFRLYVQLTNKPEPAPRKEAAPEQTREARAEATYGGLGLN